MTHPPCCRNTLRAKIAVLLFVLALLVGLSPGMGQAAQPQETKPLEQFPGQKLINKDSPITISADKLEISQKAGTVAFEGHVSAQQDNLLITGKKLTIYAVKEKPKGGKDNPGGGGVVDQIDRIEIEGEVKITQENKLATCDKAVYYRPEQKIVLSGNPRVSQGKDELYGQLITLYIMEERSVIEGGTQKPVQATIYPEGKKIQ
jgi:lipopolysaccharide export system protein LptA